VPRRLKNPTARVERSAEDRSVAVKVNTRESAIVPYLLGRARRAREDVAEFFSLVLREETTRERVAVVPHQRLLFEFVTSHDHCVVRMPVGFGKTYSLTAMGLWQLGREQTARGAILSATQGQASKPLMMVRDYIEGVAGDGELRMVFTRLRPTQREGDPWTNTKITVDRPAGIRDPSLVAVGLGGSLPGARLSWILVDDVLDEENTRTAEQRANVKRWFNSIVLGRRDIRGSRIAVVNTPWHPQDLTYALEDAGWPTLTMEIEGGIEIANTDWDSELIRPAFCTKDARAHRLTAHDSAAYGAPLTVIDSRSKERRLAKPGEPGAEHFDLDETIPLWPERYGPTEIARLRREFQPFEFNHLFKMRCVDEASAHCKPHWFERCKELARKMGIHSLAQGYGGQNLVVTGVDLAFGLGKQHHFSAFFTYELVPRIDVLQDDGNVRAMRNMRRILDVEIGRWTGPEIINRVLDKQRRFNSIVAVETNAAQDLIRQWALERDQAVIVKAHTTGSNKHHRAFGVESLFIEIENGAWLIPNDNEGRCHPMVQKWVDACIGYQPPPAHTEDVLVASWIAREQARKVLTGSDLEEHGDIGAEVAAR
jgi:hypothetical protein